MSQSDAKAAVFGSRSVCAWSGQSSPDPGSLGIFPVQFGAYRDKYCGLVTTRLSILDIAGGQQPIANEDESLWIVYNGEIFNDLQLRYHLIKLGHKFHTHTYTEVVLHLYESYGPEALKYLNGQFAVAIWNSRENSLFLARDRMGIRPLY